MLKDHSREVGSSTTPSAMALCLDRTHPDTHVQGLCFAQELLVGHWHIDV
jgi:hypothetical protein